MVDRARWAQTSALPLSLSLLEICGSLAVTVVRGLLKKVYWRVIPATRGKELRHRAFSLALTRLPVCPLLRCVVGCVQALLLAGVTLIVERGTDAIGNPAQLIDAEPSYLFPAHSDNHYAIFTTE